jgi:hypothetical protein
MAFGGSQLWEGVPRQIKSSHKNHLSCILDLKQRSLNPSLDQSLPDAFRHLFCVSGQRDIDNRGFFLVLFPSGPTA